MNPWIEIVVLVIDTLASLYLSFVVLRFLLQVARADFYNQFSQAIVKVTNPLLIPLRKVIPGAGGIDIASIVLALLLQLVIGELLAIIVAQQWINPLQMTLWGLIGLLKLSTYIAYICLIVLVVTSFIAPHSSHPALVLVRQLMDPILNPVKRIIPPMGGLDFSVLFVFLGLTVLQKMLDIFASNVGLVPLVVIGY
ncbi:YggT family protein [Teredinibacter purpureus]|jgi:YGGT family.|uniref:YggT family protein n=1 Tax=Teredinibacter purpureus TaxID=2731756 RepID=UPI0005F7F63D|nr:YggT family protein [Teredinibacter purpureus]